MARDYIDAKFKVIRPKRRWRLSFDWRNFWFVAVVVIIAAFRSMPGTH